MEQKMINERLKKEDISRELEKSIILEEVSWRLKSRALWLREEDNNTKFFHHLANSHRRNNLVESLVVNGNRMSYFVEIKEHIVNFHKQLYLEQYMWRPKFDGFSFLSIDVEEINWMEREFQGSEMLEVVRNFNGDKAPGFDGFSIIFFQKYWEVIKKRHYGSFQGFS
jgi:hypothetical protein